MKILAIETSCDETAISIMEATGDISQLRLTSLADVVLSQNEVHSEYGGVFPTLAKREHAKNITFLLEKVLRDSGLYFKEKRSLDHLQKKFASLFSREEDLANKLLDFLKDSAVPKIDAIAVTAGPGLEPALWVGINVAKAISEAWNKPIIAINHLEGHIASVLFDKDQNKENKTPELPFLALIISGGHTELIEIREWGEYDYLGGTLDDAVGEAFDKVARMLNLPYPGGPPLSKLAKKSRSEGKENPFVLPRPMRHSGDLNFSFSGLKTAVLYTVKKQTSEITEEIKAFIARAFEDAVADVLAEKVEKALEEKKYKTLIICGGVSANRFIRERFKEIGRKTGVKVLIPNIVLSGDNACMIAVAGFLTYSNRPSDVLKNKEDIDRLSARGNAGMTKHFLNY